MFARQTRNSGTAAVVPSNAPSIFNENNVTHKGVTTRSSRPALKDLSNQVNEITKRVDKDKKDEKKATLPVLQVPAKNANPAVKNLTLKENIVNANKQQIAKPQAKPKEDIEVEDLESPLYDDEDDNSEDEETQEQFDAMEIEGLGEVRPLQLHDNELEPEDFAAPLDESIDDIDLNDMDDPQFCSEYVHLIFNYLRKVEVCFFPRHHSFLGQIKTRCTLHGKTKGCN